MNWHHATERVRATLFAAQDFAAARGEALLTPEHLLVSLCEVWQSEGQEVLARCGVSVLELRAAAVSALPAPGSAVPRAYEQELSPSGRQVLAYAQQEGLALDTAIYTDHLLLGMLREADCPAARLLRERGLTLDGTREVCAQKAAARGRRAAVAVVGMLAR